jgi:hypothetical protein
MPEPFDYHNPQTPPEQNTPEAPPASARATIPVEFDALLTQTDDHAAAKAIEAALRREKIKVFLAGSGNAVARVIDLYIQSADQERAAKIAAVIFARRHKLKSFPRQKMPRDEDSGLDGFDITSSMG